MSALAWLRAWTRTQTLGLHSARATLRAWGRRHPRWRRAGRVTSLVLLLNLFVAAGAAFAGDDGQSGNPFLKAFGVKDSDGNSVSKYNLDLDSGGGFFPGASDVIGGMLEFLVTLGWEVYRVVVTVALWFLDLALQFRLLDTLRPAASLIANSLQTSIGALGIVPVFLVISFIAMLYWISKRRAGAGILDFFLSMLASALLTSALANPVGWIAGDDGLLSNSRDIGIAMAVGVTSGGQQSATDSKTLRRQTTGMLADKFIRIPHQLINYGAVVDENKKCAKVYDKQLEDGKLGDARDAMGDCKESYKDASENPLQALTGVIVLTPAGLILVALSGLLGLILLTYMLTALYIGAKNVIDLARASLPGSEKAGILRNLTTLLVLGVALVLLLVVVGAFLVFVDALFTGYKSVGLSLIEAFVLLDIIMFIAVIALLMFWWKSHKAGKELGDKLHQATAPQPVSPAPSNGARAANMIGSRAATVATMATQRHNSSRVADAIGHRPGTSDAGDAPAAASTKQGKAALLARMGKGVAKGGVAAVKYGAMSTVGAPVYAPRAAVATKKAFQAKRAATHTKLSQAKARVQAKVADKTRDAKAFGQEYAHNVGVAGRFIGRATGAAHLAGVGMSMGAGPLAAGALAGGMLGAGTPKRREGHVHQSTTKAQDRNPTPIRAPHRPGVPYRSAAEVMLKDRNGPTGKTGDGISRGPDVGGSPAGRPGPIESGPAEAPQVSPANIPTVQQTDAAPTDAEVGRRKLLEREARERQEDAERRRADEERRAEQKRSQQRAKERLQARLNERNHGMPKAVGDE